MRSDRHREGQDLSGSESCGSESKDGRGQPVGHAASTGIGAIALVILATAVSAETRAAVQNRDELLELQQRAQEQLARERLEIFIEDTFEFFEITGELVSFRVHPEMTDSELQIIDERSRELDAQAGRLISYVRDVAPYVRGRTDGLWEILDPPDEDSTLEERLTLILALTNGISPKLDQLIAFLSEELEPTIPAEDLVMDNLAPYLIVGGLEELRSMTQDLRRAF